MQVGVAKLASVFDYAPRQSKDLTSADALVEHARDHAAEFHAHAMGFITGSGGRYERGSMPTLEQVREQTEASLGSDYTRVLNVLCDTGVWTDLQGIETAIKALLKNETMFHVLMVKDRINSPTSTGFREVELKVKIAGQSHVGTIKLHLQPFLDREAVSQRTVGSELPPPPTKSSP